MYTRNTSTFSPSLSIPKKVKISLPNVYSIVHQSTITLNIVEYAMIAHFKGKPWHFVLSTSKYYTSKVVDRQIREFENMANDLMSIFYQHQTYFLFY